MRPLPGDLLDRLKDGGRNLTVLVLRMGALGDILRTLPPVRLLRAHLPEAKILWLVDEPWAPILREHPDLNETIPLPRAAWRRMMHSPRGLFRVVPAFEGFVRELRGRGPNLVVDFHGNLRSALLGFLSQAPVRLGYAGHQQKEGNRWFTTHHVGSGPRRISRMERNLTLVRALGAPDHPLPDGGLPLSPRHVAAAREIVASFTKPGAAHAVLSPGASRNQAYKKPPVQLLAAAARHLAARGIAPLAVYGPGEEPDAKELVRSSEGQAHLAPPTDLHVLAALLAEARLFVGGDSGPLHLACSVGCPVLGLYGPTDPAVNEPWGVPHVALHPPGRIYTGVKSRDRVSGGFAGLEPSAVGEAVDRVLGLASRGKT